MQKKLFIHCDQDSLQFQNDRKINTTKNQRSSRSPLHKNQKMFDFAKNLSYCQTPQNNQRSKSKSPFQFKSPKYIGIIEKALLQRLKYYDRKSKTKYQTSQTSFKIKQQEIFIQQLRQKPEINQVSLQLFQKVKNQRKLSPNILERFQTYQCQKVSRTAKYDLMKTYGLTIKTNTLACRGIQKKMNETVLNQKSLNIQRSKSWTKGKVKNPQNIGKLFIKKRDKQMNLDSSVQQRGHKIQDDIRKGGCITPLKEKTYKNKKKEEIEDNQQIEGWSWLKKKTLPLCSKKRYTDTKKWKIIS